MLSEETEEEYKLGITAKQPLNIYGSVKSRIERGSWLPSDDNTVYAQIKAHATLYICSHL